jgi:nucleoside-diphosphate-sugar epimerase
VPTDETVALSVPDPLNPRYSYGGGKITSELLAIHVGRAHLDHVTIVRPHNVYGPDMGWEHVIPQFAVRMRQLARDGAGPVKFPIQGSGEETRAFVYIDDLVDGFLRVVTCGQHLEIYHVGTDRETPIAALAAEVGRYYQRAVTVVPGALSPGGTRRRCPDITKVRALGYEPRTTLRDGLAVTLRWYDEHAPDDGL